MSSADDLDRTLQLVLDMNLDCLKMRFAGVRVSGSRFQPRQVLFTSSRFSSLSTKRLRLDTALYSSNEVSTTGSQQDSELEEVITLTPKTNTSSDIKTLRQAPHRQSRVSISSPDSTPKTTVTEQIFSPGAEDYLDQKTKPLKINRDLLMVWMLCCFSELNFVLVSCKGL